jgi:uncharacterized protein GlcG (DUF336 family)
MRALASPRLAAAIGAIVLVTGANAQQATYPVRTLTPEAALRAASAALAACSKAGYQVAVAVTDRSGVALVMLRDRHAGPHTPATATGKAWTSVSFRQDTLSFARVTQAGEADDVCAKAGIAAIQDELDF